MNEYIFLGDSITDCDHIESPDGLGDGYVKMISQLLPDSASCINLGYEGFTISALSRMWKRRNLTQSPKCISILIGINDIAVIKNTGLPLSSALEVFHENYEQLITCIRQRFSCPIIIIEPFIFSRPAEYITWQPAVHEMNVHIKAISDKYNLYYLPAWASMNDVSLSTDGVHLNEAGHRLLADLWIKFVRDIEII